MTKYTAKDAAKDTQVKVGYVKAAWHNAKNDAVGTKYEGRKEKRKAARYSREKHGPHKK